jgi:hypothetical protein
MDRNTSLVALLDSVTIHSCEDDQDVRAASGPITLKIWFLKCRGRVAAGIL